jgi:DNA-binding MarR family transcriptional regulator
MDQTLPATTPPERTLGLVLHDVARFLRKRFEQRAREAELGLTRAQWSVLAQLSRHEGINQAALAQILEIEPITLVRLLDRLQAAGLVERRPDPGDRRARVLYLTPATRPLLERIWALAAVVREEAMAGLPEPEREQLFRMLLKIKANLTEPAPDGALAELPRQVSRG